MAAIMDLSNEGRRYNIDRWSKISFEKERNELEELNGMLATYIESVGSREVTDEYLEKIEKMRETFFQTETHIKHKYTAEIRDANSTIKKQKEQLASLELKVFRLEVNEKEFVQLQDRVEELMSKIQERETTIAGLKYKLNKTQEDNGRIIREKKTIIHELQITLTRIQNERGTLEDKKFDLENTLDVENKKLREIVSSFKFIRSNIEEVHLAEFRKSISDIKAHYKIQLDNAMREFVTFFTQRDIFRPGLLEYRHLLDMKIRKQDYTEWREKLVYDRSDIHISLQENGEQTQPSVSEPGDVSKQNEMDRSATYGPESDTDKTPEPKDE